MNFRRCGLVTSTENLGPLTRMIVHSVIVIGSPPLPLPFRQPRPELSVLGATMASCLVEGPDLTCPSGYRRPRPQILPGKTSGPAIPRCGGQRSSAETIRAKMPICASQTHPPSALLKGGTRLSQERSRKPAYEQLRDRLNLLFYYNRHR